MPKSGGQDLGPGLVPGGMARAARRGLEVSLLAVVAVEGRRGLPPLRPAVSGRPRRPAGRRAGAPTGRETPVDAGLARAR